MSVAGTTVEAMTTIKFLGVATVKALDTLPLSLLVVIFLACLVLLQWPFPPSPSLLPTHTPPTYSEKLAGSHTFPSNTFPASSSQTAHSKGSTQPQLYTVAVATMNGQQQIVQVLQPVAMGRNVRRGSKQLREYRSGLGVVEEVDGEEGREIV
ncbi:hypothetical protein IAR50_005715 [Cryptococcus sp. DSM 104548]